MKRIKYLLFSLLCMFCSCLVLAKGEITIEKMIPVYDENSGVIVSEEIGVQSVVFNDKDQNVKYNIVLKNNTKKDISLSDIVLPESPEEFFKYEFVGIDENTVLKSNSTEEVILSLETVKTEGWGRNFTLDLTSKVEIMDNVVNPNTSTMGIVIILVVITFFTVILITTVKSKRISRYVALIIMFGSIISVTKAKDSILLPLKLNVSFESQNVMKSNSCYFADEEYYDYAGCDDYWSHNHNIKKFYIENEIREISEYEYKYDVSKEQNEKVIAYLVENEEDSSSFDLYLMADGIIYANENASFYFADMINLDYIENLDGFDTSKVTNMSHMFGNFGVNINSTIFNPDFSSINTSNVKNMSYMFYKTGASQYITDFTLNLKNFDTSNVTDMSGMFSNAGFNSTNITLNISNFDTRKVTYMNKMFLGTGTNSTNFTLDLRNFDTSNVTDMSLMFSNTGCNNPNFTLDVSNFDTSNVTDMSSMFEFTGYNNPNFTLDVSNFDTSNVENMYCMFSNTGYNSEIFDIDTSNFDMSKVKDVRAMFNGAGYNSTKLNTSITINKNNYSKYDYLNMFKNVATKSGSKITVNYTSETSELVDQMIATKSSNSNVVKGIQVD